MVSLSITSKRFLNTSIDGDFTPSLSSPIQRLTALREVVFPNIRPGSPLAKLGAIPSSPIASDVGEEADFLSTTSLRVVWGVFHTNHSVYPMHSVQDLIGAKCQQYCFSDFSELETKWMCYQFPQSHRHQQMNRTMMCEPGCRWTV